MKLPRYPKYKDSGVKWLGQVPEHWNHAHPPAACIDWLFWASC
jgi:type I restriction enzyme S subunit